MATWELPVVFTGDETRVETVFELETRVWQFRFYVNRVNDSWSYDLLNDSAAVVLEGMPLAVGVDLLFDHSGTDIEGHRHPPIDIPAGILFLAEKGEGTGGKNPDEAAFKEGRIGLYYRESEDDGDD